MFDIITRVSLKKMVAGLAADLNSAKRSARRGGTATWPTRVGSVPQHFSQTHPGHEGGGLKV